MVKEQAGFTLVSVMVAIGIMLSVSAALTPMYVEQVRKSKTVVTKGEVEAIGSAAQKYAADTGDWPDSANACNGALATLKAAGYLPAMDDKSPWYDAASNPGGQYTFSCNSSRFDIDVTTDADWAAYLENRLAVTTRAGSTTTTSYPLAASVPALAGMLHRTYDPAHPEYNRMETNIDMNGNDLNNTNSVRANNVYANDTVRANNDLRAGDDVVAGDDIYGNVLYSDAVDNRYWMNTDDLSARDLIRGRRIYDDTKQRYLSQAIQDAGIYQPYNWVAKPRCLSWQTPQIFVVPVWVASGSSAEPLGGIFAWAENIHSSYWRVRLTITTNTGTKEAPSTHGRIAAFTKCT